MTEERFRSLLQDISVGLVAGGSNSQKLWDILTALRGPDIEDDYTAAASLKSCTTSVIRWRLYSLSAPGLQSLAIGRSKAALSYARGMTINGAFLQPDSIQLLNKRLTFGVPDEENYRLKPQQSGDRTFHFLFHAFEAFKALDMKWDQVNP
jgi:hypothetical protein